MYGIQNTNTHSIEMTNINILSLNVSMLDSFAFATQELEMGTEFGKIKCYRNDHMLDDFKQVSPIHFELNLNKLSINAFLF